MIIERVQLDPDEGVVRSWQIQVKTGRSSDV
jgi:hypothetical protein